MDRKSIKCAYCGAEDELAIQQLLDVYPKDRILFCWFCDTECQNQYEQDSARALNDEERSEATHQQLHKRKEES